MGYCFGDVSAIIIVLVKILYYSTAIIAIMRGVLLKYLIGTKDEEGHRVTMLRTRAYMNALFADVQHPLPWNLVILILQGVSLNVPQKSELITFFLFDRFTSNFQEILFIQNYVGTQSFVDLLGMNWVLQRVCPELWYSWNWNNWTFRAIYFNIFGQTYCLLRAYNIWHEF